MAEQTPPTIAGEVGPGEFYPVVGVGPHPKPWPTDDHFDAELLANGDRRNVLDHYRYWKVSALLPILIPSGTYCRLQLKIGSTI